MINYNNQKEKNMKIAQYLLMITVLSSAAMSFNVLAHDSDENSSEIIPVNSAVVTEAGKAIAQFHHALKSGNRKKARSLLADKVTIFEGGRVERSADEYAKHHMLADMKFLAEINTEVLEHQVKVIGDFAYSMSRSKSTGQYQGNDINSEGMESMVLLKEEGKWKIVHIHWSQ